MTFEEWFEKEQGRPRVSTPIARSWAKAGWIAAVAEALDACHVESRPDGCWLVLHNEHGDAAIHLLHEQRGPIVRAVIEAAALNAGKEANCAEASKKKT